MGKLVYHKGILYEVGPEHPLAQKQRRKRTWKDTEEAFNQFDRRYKG